MIPEKRKRGPIEVQLMPVKIRVYTQREPDGEWAARVPGLMDRCSKASTREAAIEMACREATLRECETAISDGSREGYCRLDTNEEED